MATDIRLATKFNLDDWKTAREVPSGAELMVLHRPLLNDIRTPPSNKEEYLKTHYSILRHEGVELLRRSVLEFRSQPTMRESDQTHIYTCVYVKGYHMTKLGPICRVAFSVERSDKHIRWNLSKRLTPGTLVVLSPAHDKFETCCHVATVGNRYIIGGLEPDPQKGEGPDTPPRIDLLWGHPDDAILDPGKELIMVEAKSAYFESVRHAMTGLQRAVDEVSVLDKYILGQSQEQRIPEYITQLYDRGWKIRSQLVGYDATVEMNDLPRFAEKAAESHELDSSQLRALEMVLSSELVQIQGPPGTGKTFTSLTAMSTLVNNFLETASPVRLGPIIVSAQSNFAVDQFLLGCEKKGISFARLGGRSSNELVAERSLYKLRLDSSAPTHGYFRHAKQVKVCEEKIARLFRLVFSDALLDPQELLSCGLISEAQYNSLLGNDEFESLEETAEDSSPGSRIALWLGDQFTTYSNAEYRAPQVNNYEVEIGEEEEVEDDKLVDDDERDRVVGNYYEIKIPLTGRVRRQNWRKCADDLLKTKHDLFMIRPHDRGMVYRRLQEILIARQTTHFRVLVKEYDELVQKMKQSRAEADSSLVKSLGVQIVGCTTTGLCKYREFFLSLKPKVLLIEEAAQTWEGNILASLFPSLEQLILVGDHKQLVPQTSVKELAREPFHLNVSLLERMIMQRFKHVTLQVQRRMIPELRQIFQPFYPPIADHEIVQTLQPVPGMGENCWFFDHNWPEGKNENSRYNIEEALMITGFYRYLVQNGVDPMSITVLTFYRGQLAELGKHLRRDPVIKAMHPSGVFLISTVDGFQGKENDVILLSLTRSMRKARADAGFLADQNRLIVSMSRARRGLYIFGDCTNIKRDDFAGPIWDPILELLEGKNKITCLLPIKCQKHHTVSQIGSPTDWNYYNGGCRKRCEGIACEFGHRCKLNCHPFECARQSCPAACIRVLSCGHECKKHCGEPCGCVGGASCGERVKPSPSKKRDSWQNLDSMMTEPASKQVEATMLISTSPIISNSPIISDYFVTANPTPSETDASSASFVTASASLDGEAGIHDPRLVAPWGGGELVLDVALQVQLMQMELDEYTADAKMTRDVVVSQRARGEKLSEEQNLIEF